VTKPKDIPLNSYTNANNMEYVVQPYIDNPLVLEKKKFDLRLYILISSLDPYICYLNEEGLARFCAEDYQPLIIASTRIMRSLYQQMGFLARAANAA
jgi:hypothetical protein